MASPAEVIPPSVGDVAEARRLLGDRVRTTPTWQWRSLWLEQQVGADTEVHLKLELFQYAGSFKTRGALVNMLALSDEALSRGVTAVSAGNHAMAVSFAARILGTTAKVVMPKNASPVRVEACRQQGAEVVLVDDVHQAFEETRRIEKEEGRTFVHPFEGRETILGTATVGLEFIEQVPDLDAMIVPIGGGGLCAGIATAVVQQRPECTIYGVEPEGADSMHRSFAKGEPASIDAVRTIADSLGAPYALPYSFELCRRFVDELVLVDDDMLRAAMAALFREAKLAVEPAGAASTAALLNPLRDKLRGRKVGLIVCGANIDAGSFGEMIAGNSL